MDCARTRTLLEAFADGELAEADAREVREHLGGCAAGCPAELRAQQAVGEALRARLTARVAEADFSALWGNVERGLAKARAAEPPSLAERLRTWLGELLTYRAPLVAAVAAAVLAVAVAFPLLRLVGGRVGPGGPGTGGGTGAIGLDVGLGAASLVDITSLESSGTVTVWPVPAADGGETTIIWISADDSGDTLHDGAAPGGAGDLGAPGGEESRPAAPRLTQGTPG
jgi:hypothetical protein